MKNVSWTRMIRDLPYFILRALKNVWTSNSCFLQALKMFRLQTKAYKARVMLFKTEKEHLVAPNRLIKNIMTQQYWKDYTGKKPSKEHIE